MSVIAIPEDRLRRLTTADVIAMYEAGVFRPDEKVELIEGRLIEMSPKHRRHEHVKSRLVRWLNRRLPTRFAVFIEPSLYLTDDTFIDPDILVLPEDMPSDAARGPDVLLAVEIADATLRYDLGAKAALYAKHGVRDLWVIDAETRAAHLHAEPTAQGYASIRQASAEEALALPFLPELSVALADLD